MGKQPEVLEHHGDLGAAQFAQVALAEVTDVVAVDCDAAARGFDQAGQGTQQGRFPRARQPHNHEAFATPDLEIDILDGDDMAGFLLNRVAGFAAVVGVEHLLGISPEDFPNARGGDHRIQSKSSLVASRCDALYLPQHGW